MALPFLETKRLFLRRFAGEDMDALYLLLRDEKVNTFLPWFPVKTVEETAAFFQSRFAEAEYCFALCLKTDHIPIGYINVSAGESHDLGYALRKEFWRRGLAAEAGIRVVEYLKGEGVPYITATHDVNNPASGRVMQKLGMGYCYSYREQWQPKDIPVTFRLYQLNLDGQGERVYRKYWDRYPHWVETDLLS